MRKGYRETHNGKFRAEIYDGKRNVNLGTFETEYEAAEAYKTAKEYRLRKNILTHGYSLENGVVYKNDYIVFDDGTIFGHNGIKIKQNTNSRGYLQCDINGRTESVHRIIAECFIPNRYDKTQINHINGNKLDNRVENLEWCTPKENTRHAYNMGLASGKSKYGESNGRAKLTQKDVMYIREKYDSKDRNNNQTALAKKFNIGSNAIHKIIHYKSWPES